MEDVQMVSNITRKNKSYVVIYTATRENVSTFRGRVVLCIKREGIETKGGGDGMTYRFFPSPRRGTASLLWSL